jgi:Tfp pilus assembly protein PilO
MTKYLKVEGNDGLVRDTDTLAILNTNSSEYQKYVAQRESLRVRNEEMARQAAEINNLKEDLSEIKQMLKALIKG